MGFVPEDTSKGRSKMMDNDTGARGKFGDEAGAGWASTGTMLLSAGAVVRGGLWSKEEEVPSMMAFRHFDHTRQPVPETAPTDRPPFDPSLLFYTCRRRERHPCSPFSSSGEREAIPT